MSEIGIPTISGQAREKAAALEKQMRALQAEAVRSSARLAGLAAGRTTQTRARSSSTSGGLAGGGQSQRMGGIEGGKVGGPLGHRGPMGTTARE